MSEPLRHFFASLALSSTPGLPQHFPWPRTPFHSPCAVSPCLRNMQQDQSPAPHSPVLLSRALLNSCPIPASACPFPQGDVQCPGWGCPLCPLNCPAPSRAVGTGPALPKRLGSSHRSWPQEATSLCCARQLN